MHGRIIYCGKHVFNSSIFIIGIQFKFQAGGSDNDGVNYTNAVITYTVAYSGTVTPGGPTSTQPCVPTGGNFTLNEHKADSLQFNYGDQYRGEIQLDKNGNVYIASSTRSSNFPVVGGFDNSLGGKQDAVVLKFNPNLTGVVWSSIWEVPKMMQDIH